MLEAEKKQLEATLAVDVLRVRDRELQFYSDATATIGTQAALLAALSSAVLTALPGEMKTPREGWISYSTAQAWGMPREYDSVDESNTGIGTWSVWTWLEQLLQLGEIITCVACLTTQLVLIQRCALIEIGGLSLALRGPDGSAQKALHYMRLEVKRHQRMMVRGIQFLAMTIVLLLLKDLPLPLSVIPAIIATGRLVHGQRQYYLLKAAIDLPLDQMQSSTPGGPPTPLRSRRLRQLANRIEELKNTFPKKFYKCICCEDDAEAEVLERANSRVRTTAQVVKNLIKRNQNLDQVGGGGALLPEERFASPAVQVEVRRGDIRDSMMPRGFSVLEEASGAGAGGGAPAPPGIARNKSATLIQKMFRGNLARREPPPKQVEFSLARPPPIFVGADEPSTAVVTAAPPFHEPPDDYNPMERCLRGGGGAGLTSPVRGGGGGGQSGGGKYCFGFGERGI